MFYFKYILLNWNFRYQIIVYGISVPSDFFHLSVAKVGLDFCVQEEDVTHYQSILDQNFTVCQDRGGQRLGHYFNLNFGLIGCSFVYCWNFTAWKDEHCKNDREDGEVRPSYSWTLRLCPEEVKLFQHSWVLLLLEGRWMWRSRACGMRKDIIWEIALDWVLKFCGFDKCLHVIELTFEIFVLGLKPGIF